MKQKWIFLCFLLALLAVGCSEDGDTSKNIILTEGTQTTQIIYADQTQPGNGGGISFTALEAWTATVTEVTATKAEGSTVDWLTLSAYSGGPGEYTLTLTLKENLTGQNRKAKIEIRCGSDVITITVEQKGTTEEGATPEEPVQPAGVKYYVTRIDEESIVMDGPAHKNIYYFTYDDQGRFIQADSDDSGVGDESEIYTTTCQYDGNTIMVSQFYPYDDKEMTEPSTGTAEGSYVRKPLLRTRTASVDEPYVTIYTLGADGYATSFAYEWYDDEEKLTGSGTAEYDAEGYLIGGTEKYIWSYPTYSEEGDLQTRGTWQEGNLVKVVLEDHAEHLSDAAEMTYDNPDYINNPEVNLDLTWIICDSYALSAFPAEGGGVLNAFGYMGKRGAHLMTRERYSSVSGSSTYDTEVTYTYEYDDLNRPVKVYKKLYYDYSDSVTEYTYTITYAE